MTWGAKLLVTVHVRQWLDIQGERCSNETTRSARWALQPREDVEDMVSTRPTGLKRQLDGDQYRFQSVHGGRRENLHHYPVPRILANMLTVITPVLLLGVQAGIEHVGQFSMQIFS